MLSDYGRPGGERARPVSFSGLPGQPADAGGDLVDQGPQLAGHAAGSSRRQVACLEGAQQPVGLLAGLGSPGGPAGPEGSLLLGTGHSHTGT